MSRNRGSKKKNGRRTGYRKRHKKSKVRVKHDKLESKPMKEIEKELADAEKLLAEEEALKKRLAAAKKVAKRVKPLAPEGEVQGGMRFDWEKKRQALREEKLAKKLAKEKRNDPARNKEMSIDDAKAQVGLTSDANDATSSVNPLIQKNQNEDSDEIEVMDLEALKKLRAAREATEAEFFSADEEDEEEAEVGQSNDEDMEEEEECPELVEKVQSEKKGVATPEMIKAFLIAAAKGDFKEFKNLLVIHKPLSLHSRDPATGLTALLAACGKGQVHIARWALGRGADPTLRCRRNGYNAMQYACMAGSSDLIELLLERKKDIKKLVKARSPITGLGALHALAEGPMDWDHPMCQGIIQSLRVFGAPRGGAVGAHRCQSAADIARRGKKNNSMVKALI